MNILALDTSSEWCSAALWRSGAVIAREQLAGQRHSELILPMVDAVLAEASLALSRLDAIAFGAGPGSFTGLRIACGVTQGLALGADVPVVPVGTLEALAEASDAPRAICALDARMGEIYHAAYAREGEQWAVVHAPSLCRPDAVPEVAGDGWAGCGSGFAVHPETLAARYAGQMSVVRGDLFPHAAAMASIAARAVTRGNVLDPALAAPLYVRNKVALTVDERRSAQLAAGVRPA